MANYLVIALISVGASALTFFSGFGLGTILLPAFVFFFPPEVAVAMTAIVHFLNNIFKLALIGKHADKGTVVRFGVPAIASALIGASILSNLGKSEPIHTYLLAGKEHSITPIGLVIGGLMIFFAILELLPTEKQWQFPAKYMPLGGLISGFFGGLSGHQGAFRTMFLIRSGLSKESFIATGVVVACLVDIGRLGIYGTKFSWAMVSNQIGLLVVAVLAAFAGAYWGQSHLTKVTIKGLQRTIGILLAVLGLCLAAGVI